MTAGFPPQRDAAEVRQAAFDALEDLPGDYPVVSVGRSQLRVRDIYDELADGRVSPESVLRTLRNRRMLRPTGGAL